MGEGDKQTSGQAAKRGFREKTKSSSRRHKGWRPLLLLALLHGLLRGLELLLLLGLLLLELNVGLQFANRSV